MRNYYFTATSLPPLQMGIPPEISFHAFQNLMHDNLSTSDLHKAEIISRYYDIENIRAFWKKEPFDEHGNLNEVELEEGLLARQDLPEYVYDFLDAYDNKESRLEHFPELIAKYFKVESEEATGFLKQYLSFEREWRLVFAAFRAKKLGRDVAKELQYEDPNDEIVAQIMAQKDAKTFVPPDGYEDLKVIFDEHGDKPLELFKALCEYRFHHIEEMLGIDVFSINYILGYMAQLITVEKWIGLDQQKGMNIVQNVFKGA